MLRGYAEIMGRFPTVGAGSEVFHAVFNPFHWLAERHRVKAGEDVLRIDTELEPKCAADVGCAHAVVAHTSGSGAPST